MGTRPGGTTPTILCGRFCSGTGARVSVEDADDRDGSPTKPGIPDFAWHGERRQTRGVGADLRSLLRKPGRSLEEVQKEVSNSDVLTTKSPTASQTGPTRQSDLPNSIP